VKKLQVFLLSLCLWAPCSAQGPHSVVSYNIRYAARGDAGQRQWGQRCDQVVDYLHRSGATLIGLQEALNHQLSDLKKGLSGFQFVGVGRDDGKEKGEFSPIFYDPKTWELDAKQSGTFWLSESPEKPGSMSWGNEIPRICTWARFIDNGGKGLYLYNTHWDHRSQASRVKSAQLIAQMIQKRQHPNDPYLVIGDFNATTENPAILSLMDLAQLTTFQESQKASFNHWKPSLEAGLRIDHVFTSKGVKATTLAVEANGDPVGSDHHPVILRGLRFESREVK